MKSNITVSASKELFKTCSKQSLPIVTQWKPVPSKSPVLLLPIESKASLFQGGTQIPRGISSDSTALSPSLSQRSIEEDHVNGYPAVTGERPTVKWASIPDIQVDVSPSVSPLVSFVKRFESDACVEKIHIYSAVDVENDSQLVLAE